MFRHNLRVEQISQKPVAELFATLSDHNRLGAILGAPIRRIHDGSPEVNGIGSVRRIGLGPLAIEETVTGLEPGSEIAYRISRGGGPIRDHRGRIEFHPFGEGSRVTWFISFETPLPLLGSVVERILMLALRRGLRRVA